MKICMFGLGSIGQRHLKNITDILKERSIYFEVDAFRTSQNPLRPEIKSLIKREFFEEEELPNDYDIIFITNPTIAHYETIKNNICRTKHMFIEKPVFDRGDYAVEDLALKKEGIYYVACPLRYTSAIQYVKEIVRSRKKIYSVRVICSSYLPDWRPEIDYRSNYSAKKELGGGVLLDLIHEWDYLVYLFGKPIELYKISGTYSDLEINSEDIGIYIARYEDKLLELHLDYFGRKQERRIELFGSDCKIDIDVIKYKVEFYKKDEYEEIHLKQTDFYIAEIKYFLDCVEGKEKNSNTIDYAAKLLEQVL